eukprot:2351980-Amphidinium_carterae.1
MSACWAPSAALRPICGEIFVDNKDHRERCYNRRKQIAEMIPSADTSTLRVLTLASTKPRE